jgi:hypothetical protein
MGGGTGAVRVAQPACRPALKAVKRGRKVLLSCNVSGDVKLRFRGAGSRTLTLSAHKRVG